MQTEKPKRVFHAGACLTQAVHKLPQELKAPSRSFWQDCLWYGALMVFIHQAAAIAVFECLTDIAIITFGRAFLSWSVATMLAMQEIAPTATQVAEAVVEEIPELERLV